MRISIFPLPGVILFPGMQVPLHIFEPRYRALVKDALANLPPGLASHVSVVDAKGYLVDNPARLWSVNGANVALDGKGQWRVTISPDKPGDGAWLPGIKRQPFQLTLRMYNPGASFRADPEKSLLPRSNCSRQTA